MLAHNMAEAGVRSPKRRKLEGGSSQQAIGCSLDTPTSERVSTWVEESPASGAYSTTIPLRARLPETPKSANSDDFSEYGETPKQAAHNDSTHELSHVQIPRATLPSAAYVGGRPAEKTWSERRFWEEFSYNLPEYVDGNRYIDLVDFTIYRPSDSKRSMEMCSLDKLHTAWGVDKLAFSGTLLTATTSYYVHQVSFSTLAVDGYGDTDCVSLAEKICIQSTIAQWNDTWFRLGRPSSEYRSFYEDFTWLATFTKFFVEFLLEEEKVTLHHFRSKFFPWLVRQYGHSADFQTWHKKCGNQQDFGTSAAAYANYLYKECDSIDDASSTLTRYPIWREIDPQNLAAIKRQPLEGTATIVTPFTHRCFEDMYFASHLKTKLPCDEVLAAIVDRKRELCLTPRDSTPVARPHPAIESDHVLDIQQGDVICTKPNFADQWKRSKAETWYAYVQSVRQNRKGNVKLDVLWLYEPSDTTLGDAYYPFENELFLSDNCSCGEDAIPLEAVVAKLQVTWFANDPHAVSGGYFIRHKYQTVEDEDSYGFVTLTSGDFSCHASHLSDFQTCSSYYKAGQAVLVRPRSNDLDQLLQPMRILRFDVDKEKVILQLFVRSSTIDTTAPVNELLESDVEGEVPAARIVRTCVVGEFPSREHVCLPFNRGGLGNLFYILKEEVLSSQSTLQTPPESGDEADVEPAREARAKTQPLAGLDLFCGGGNFGRGLEEAGVVKMQYAVDWDAPALHSYRANTDDPAETQYFLGSVNDYLSKALRGSTDVKVARIGSILLISAGSPCPGFSTMQPNKQSDQSLSFASMVSSVVAFVDTYNPQYFVLENVVPMTYNITVNGREQNVFSQILAALVALGYQVQQFLEDAWSLGSSQQRSRVFIVASAPGTVPLHPPPNTHGHPPGKEVRRRLGKTTNGLPFGVRRYEHTTFPYVSTQSATQDLPDIGNSLTQICPQFPDHRTHADQNTITRQRLAQIPVRPLGMGLVQAVHRGAITSGEAYDWVMACNPTGVRGRKESRSYSRVRPDGLFPTVLTNLHLQCGINGKVLHWEQHRSLSIMETRRAQGFLDHEVLVGAPSQQLKIVGNSVDRKVAFAMGLVIKESWDSTIRLRREILHGNAAGAEKQRHGTQTRPVVVASSGFQPLADEQANILREATRLARSAGLKTIIQTLQKKRQESQGESDRVVEWAVEDGDGFRWSGDSPADTIAVRRRTSELEVALHLR